MLSGSLSTERMADTHTRWSLKLRLSFVLPVLETGTANMPEQVPPAFP